MRNNKRARQTNRQKNEQIRIMAIREKEKDEQAEECKESMQ